MKSFNKTQHVHDVKSIIIRSENNIDSIHSGLIRYAIQHNYSFCGDVPNETNKQECIKTIVDGLPKSVKNQHRIINALYNFYSSPQEIEIHGDSWFQKFYDGVSGNYNELINIKNSLLQLSQSNGNDAAISNLLHTLLHYYCSESSRTFKLYGRDNLIKHSIIHKDFEFPLQIIQQFMLKNSSTPIFSDHAFSELLLKTVLSEDSRQTQLAKNIMLSFYGDVGKNGNLLLKSSIDSLNESAAKFCISKIKSSTLIPSESHGWRTAFEYFINHEHANRFFLDATVNSLRSMHDRDLLMFEHNSSSESSSRRHMSAL